VKLHLAVVTAVFTLAGALYGQRLETTIWLPDSNSGMLHPGCMVRNSVNNTIFVGSESPYTDECIAVIDGTTNRKLARIQLSPGSCAGALCYNPTNNKVYCAGPGSDSVTVLDGTANRILATMQVGSYPKALCYNALSNKVYCANGMGASVSVIDGADDSVIATLSAGAWPFAVCYNPVNNKVYCANWGSGDVTVIDGASDSVIATIGVGEGPVNLCYNRVMNRVYTADSYDSTLTVIDGDSDRVVATVRIGVPPEILCCNPISNRIYAGSASDSILTVIDGGTNQVRATLQLGGTVELSLDSVRNRAYWAGGLNGGSIAVIDGASDSVIDTFPAPGRLASLLCDPTSDMVYVGSWNPAMVRVLDGATGSLVASLAYEFTPEVLCYNSVDYKVYCAETWPDTQIAVVDANTNRIDTLLSPPGCPTRLCYSPADDKLYCAGYSDRDVLVFDGRTNRQVAAVSLSEGVAEVCYNPANDRVYCAGGEKIWVIDGATNQVVATVPFGGTVCWLGCNPVNNKVYCAKDNVSRASIVIIDGTADTVISELPVPATGQCWFLCYARGSNKLYCANAGLLSLLVVDGQSDSFLPPIALAHPYIPLYNPKGNRVYCWYDDDSVQLAVIDCARDTVLCAIPNWTGCPTTQMCHDSTHDKLYITSYGFATVWIMDGRTNRITDSVRAGLNPWRMVCSPPQNRVFVADYLGSSLLVICDSMTGVEERNARGTGRVPPGPTVICGNLSLPPASGMQSAKDASLLDISGRRVMDLVPGANDVRNLSPGVYFVQVGERGKTQKVLIVD